MADISKIQTPDGEVYDIKDETARNIVFVGTQAEWNALTDTEKKKYSVANITDDSDGTPDYYSTTETKTNKIWIDGKPIYRIVLQLTETISSNYSWGGRESEVKALNIDQPIRCNAVEGGYYHGGMLFLKTNGFRANAGTGINPPSFIILEYTKTTD